MKQLLTILLFLPLFIACSSDDDPTDNSKTSSFTKEDIVGNWKAERASGAAVEDFNLNNGTYLIDFNNDNTCVLVKSQVTYSGTYTVNDNKIMVKSGDETYLLLIAKKPDVNTIHIVSDSRIDIGGLKYLFIRQ